MSEPMYNEEGEACCTDCQEPLYRGLSGFLICKLCEINYGE